ncbi:hypothetical protein QVD17_09004 [Tagetes erecta]|uniref:Uncharacterized protein n=1 Tax=Tagetes erecta TaxID=13708 RepID=A0AAD8L316_TARER|nr:hypothetical protein QVD17_09004 [Tagetes erecta]
MVQSEKIKVEFSSSESEKPPNYIPLPETVKEKLCTSECAEQIEHYRSYSFRICDKFAKEERRHNKLKEDHKISTEKILSIQESWKKSLEEIESLKHQLSEIKSYHPRNRMKQVYVAKRSQVIHEENQSKKEQSNSDSSSNDNSSDYGFNNPEFIKWQKEMQQKNLDEA